MNVPTILERLILPVLEYNIPYRKVHFNPNEFKKLSKLRSLKIATKKINLLPCLLELKEIKSVKITNCKSKEINNLYSVDGLETLILNNCNFSLINFSRLINISICQTAY